MSSRVVAEYKSSRPNRDTYKVSIDDQGRCWCGCWQWKLNKTCKHVQGYQSTAPIPLPTEVKVETQDDVNPIQQAINEAVQALKGN